ncbi:sensor histidine kinase [Chitinophaga tropicalis]|uniref:Signal transduction histidine kinase internal region domain-containing protein n=1 Tax=Chitinophaga tropicalis TaxID=2683588 RepID=A0A7K1U8Q3_9BACT|nr:sensor histidine kinase [Chitinophaga tropicalis]MVT10660.1 hypothetical protein [Chitinophaga tropicalis]
MDIRQYIAEIYKHRYGKILFHILFWVLFFAARCYIGLISLNSFTKYEKGIVLVSLYATIASAFAYYSLIYLVYMPLFRKKKYVAGFISLILWIFTYSCIDYYFEMTMLQDSHWKQLMIKNSPEYYQYLQGDFSNIMLTRIATLGIVYQLFLNLSLPLLLTIIIAYTKEQVQTIELTKQNVQLELSFLKFQVNPHFLFNTLNNIYSLILHDKKELSADMVARLSAYLRYSLRSAATDKTTAEEEIKLLKDYIELETIRLNHIKVDTGFSVDTTGYYLPPLLFIPIVENAFKFCADVRNAFIKVQLTIKNGLLEFSCSNSFDSRDISGKGEGIGLVNTGKRLERYYPSKYSFLVSKEETVYFVHLKIHLL